MPNISKYPLYYTKSKKIHRHDYILSKNSEYKCSNIWTNMVTSCTGININLPKYKQGLTCIL